MKIITFDDKNLSSTTEGNRILTDNNINEIKSVVNDAIIELTGKNYLSAINPNGTGTLKIDNINVLTGIISGGHFYSTILKRNIEEESDPLFAAASANFAVHAEVPKKVSELPNDAGYITKTVSTLTNYYPTTSTYTKIEVDIISTMLSNKIPTRVSQLENDSNYIQNDVDSLKNYYRKDVADKISTYLSTNIMDNVSIISTNLKDSIPTKVSQLDNDIPYVSASELDNYYTKLAIDQKLVSKLTFKVVETRPAKKDADPYTIYLVPKKTAEEENIYDEYLLVDNKWEKLGDTKIDISNFVTYTAEDRKVLSGDITINGKIIANDLNLLDNYYNKSQIESTSANIVAKIPLSTSQLKDDIPFVSATQLNNYYTKTEVNSKLSANYIKYDNSEYDTVKAALDYLLYKPLSATSFSVSNKGQYLVGKKFDSTTISWNYAGTNTNLISQTLYINTISCPITLKSTSYTYGTIVSNELSTYTFTLTASNGKDIVTKKDYIYFNQYNFYFNASNKESIIAEPTCITILGNASPIVCTGSSLTIPFTVYCSDEYFYFAVPNVIKAKFNTMQLWNGSSEITSYKQDITEEKSFIAISQETLKLDYSIYRSPNKYGSSSEVETVNCTLKFLNK